jgi:CubicO group peptidase (beta-lactamase class C family)
MEIGTVNFKPVHRMYGFALVLAILLGVAVTPGRLAQASPHAQPDNSLIKKYRELIPQLMAEQDVPGLALAVVDDAGVLWADGFGFTDDDHKIPVTPDTIFSVQSISKNFTAAAVLLAVQDGLLDLDAPITTYLPDFTVNSIFEEHPERKITLRMLLSHTAGFTHEAPVGNNLDLGPVVFEDHVKSISDTWLRFPVGTGYAYSNLGISLAGYILQQVSGMPFERYVQENLLRPIGMDNSSFDMDQIRANPDRAIGHRSPYPEVPLEIPIVPEGGLYTSANDMAKYIQFHLNRGSVNGESLLIPALLDEMYTVPPPAQGSREGYALGVARMTWYKGRYTELLNHGGGGFGFQANLWWLPELKLGLIILTNSEDHNLLPDLELSMLYDFVHDPGSVYYSRLQELPDETPVTDGDATWRPPFGLAKMISQHELPPSETALARWKEYEGWYGATAWGALSPSGPTMRVFVQDSHLYVEGADEAERARLVEVSPGLFFAPNGEALDFRGPIPTWANMKLTRVGTGPAPWQQALLLLCGLVFLSGLLLYPIRALVRHFSRSATSPKSTSRWARLAPVLVILTSLFGLLSLVMIAMMPNIIYSGFLGWLEVPLRQKLLMHAPLAFMLAGTGFLILSVPAWRQAWWPRGERIYYLVFGLASVAALVFLGYWGLIGFGLV